LREPGSKGKPVDGDDVAPKGAAADGVSAVNKEGQEVYSDAIELASGVTKSSV
jgi:hypothetical protein